MIEKVLSTQTETVLHRNFIPRGSPESIEQKDGTFPLEKDFTFGPIIPGDLPPHMIKPISPGPLFPGRGPLFF